MAYSEGCDGDCEQVPYYSGLSQIGGPSEPSIGDEETANIQCVMSTLWDYVAGFSDLEVNHQNMLDGYSPDGSITEGDFITVGAGACLPE